MRRTDGRSPPSTAPSGALASGRVTTSIKVNNLFNEQIQYHVSATS